MLEALRLLEQDALGGSGSRGYGRVRIQQLAVDDEPLQARFDAIERVARDTENTLMENSSRA